VKPEKMSAEDVAALDLKQAAGSFWHEGEQRRLLAHIAALEAERDEWEEMHAQTAGERDSLREFLQEAESRLAAIRQRAGDMLIPGRAALIAGVTAGAAQDVARYILGDDAPAPVSEPGGVQQEAGTPCEGHDIGEFCGACGNTGVDMRATHSEPTTAEAFATVRKVLGRYPECQQDEVDDDNAQDALSLLERRIGTMGRAAHEVVRVALTGPGTIEPDVFKAVQRLELALTDAPPVFTLEEVTGTADELESIAEELMLASKHKANPGSTNGTLVQHSARLREVARALRR
jgi:hypothetical protein